MKKSVLAFLGFAFIVYWFATKDLQVRKPGLGPITPSSVTMLGPAVSKQNTARGIAGQSAGASTPAPIKEWLRDESEKVGQVDAEPSKTLRRLKAKASQLHDQELDVLSHIALDTTVNADERFLAVYMLGLSEAKTAIADLEQIGLAQIPKPRNDRQYSDEIVIRVHALDAAAKNQPPQKALSYLKKVLAKTQDATLSQQAHAWIERLIK